MLYDVPNDLFHQIPSPQTNFRSLEALVILNDCLRAELNPQFCPIDWNCKFLQGLTHLRLGHLPECCKLGCYDFALVLSKIPTLEILDLYGFLLADEGVQTHRAAKVHLQHLQQLHVASLIPEMAQFLPYLVVPRSCKVDLRTWQEYDAICDGFRAILSWILNQLRVPTKTSDASSSHEQCIRSLHLLHNPEDTDFKVEGFCDVLSREQLETADPILTFVVGWIHHDRNFHSNLRTFLSLLPLGGVAFLEVVADLDVDLSPEFRTVAFGSIQTLKTIYLERR